MKNDEMWVGCTTRLELGTNRDEKEEVGRAEAQQGAAGEHAA